MTPDFMTQLSIDIEELSKRPALQLTISPIDAWILMLQLQLACRHPDNHGASRATAEAYVKLIADLLATTPALKMIVEMGAKNNPQTPKTPSPIISRRRRNGHTRYS